MKIWSPSLNLKPLLSPPQGEGKAILIRVQR